MPINSQKDLEGHSR